MGRSHHIDATAEYSEMQVKEWKALNAQLVQQLIVVVEEPNSRKLVADLFAVRDRFHNEWRQAESDLHRKQNILCSSAESADFVKAAMLSRELVSLKSRVQAAQAAHHEINEVIRLSRLSEPQVEKVEVEQETEQLQPAPLAKVIPLLKEARRR